LIQKKFEVNMFPSVFAFFQLQIHLLICSESLLLNNINCFTSVYDHISVIFKNWISIDFFFINYCWNRNRN